MTFQSSCFFGLFISETSHTKVSGQLGNTVLHLPKGFPSLFLFNLSGTQSIFPPGSLCSDSTTFTYERKTLKATLKFAHTMYP